jgi:hypothetical protein
MKSSAEVRIEEFGEAYFGKLRASSTRVQLGGLLPQRSMELPPRQRRTRRGKIPRILACGLARAIAQAPATELLGGSAGAITHPIIEPNVLPFTPNDVFHFRATKRCRATHGSNVEEARALLDPKNVKAASFASDLERSGYLS